MNFIQKNRLLILALIALFFALTTLYYLSKYNDSEDYIILYHKAIPSIELRNVLNFYKVVNVGGNVEFLESTDPSGFGMGEVAGYIKFKKSEDQPKQFQQYYVIEADPDFYSIPVKEQYFLSEYYRMRALPTRKTTDREELSIVEDTPQVITLEQEGGVLFMINKLTKEVHISDSRGHETSLVTDEYEFKKLMMDLWGYYKYKF